MIEKELLEVLNDKFDLELESTCDDEFCRYDAHNDKYMAELKCRRAHYDTQLIEYDKLDFIKNAADSLAKDFLYCVSTPNGVYVFNVSSLCRDEYNFKWENKYLPATSDFGKSYHKTKKVGYIDINDSEFSSTLI
ncbi:MAG: hypothetical protein NZ811_00085 [Gammaproteobacteria bacterium]|nr:hypothetical protein [Gammaproteobacteria bacterium]